MVENGVPQFGYQLQFGSPDRKVEAVVQGPERIRKWLNGMYGYKSKSGKVLMDAKTGIDLSLIEHEEFPMTPLLTEEVCPSYCTREVIGVLTMW
jgi:soluble epoxide hydrolase/lipid-phosphate phosphatase